MKKKKGRAHNADGARDAILKAAEEVFSIHGFAGARIDEIAEMSGYNKGLIFRYFGNKLLLYLEVIRRVDIATSHIQANIVATLHDAETTRDAMKVRTALKQSIGEIFDFYLQNPRVMRIFQWEMADGWQNYLQIASQIDSADNLVMETMVTRLQKEGFLRSTFNPMAQIIIATFQPMLAIALNPILHASSGSLMSADLQRVREFVIEFVVGGVLADSSAVIKK